MSFPHNSSISSHAQVNFLTIIIEEIGLKLIDLEEIYIRTEVT